MLRHSKKIFFPLPAVPAAGAILLVLFALLVWAAPPLRCSAQAATPSQQSQQTQPAQQSQQAHPAQPAQPQPPAVQKQNGQFILHTTTNLVVLHATVYNNKGQMIDDLGEPSFRVYEDGVEQKLAVFSHADVPVTMGIIIDDSGSMRPKRPSVDAAALTFVKTSNPNDQVFVVNFNDVYYVDTPGNFAANMQQLESALDKIDSRGGTALYDAVVASLDHLKLGNRDKKVLLVITDGDDNSSRYTFTQLVQFAQKSNAEIYTVGLLGGDDESSGGLFHIHSGGDRHAAKVLKDLAEATGGKSYFPKSLNEVDDVCQHIAHEIRDQYTLAYYPTNTARDGSFRQVRVEAFMPNSHKHLVVRTRPGYFAPKGREYASIHAAGAVTAQTLPGR
ncbi:MAG TPA: VWA domain-containing protein [Terriglobia bacterium]|nr:VWA domain-containing protein [Terriglobia bacterium]